MRDYILSCYRNSMVLWQTRTLPFACWKYIWSLVFVYQRLDHHLAKLRHRTGLQCIDQCGFCCRNIKGEFTVLEMFPLALILSKRKKVDVWLAKLKRSFDQPKCIFLKTSSDSVQKGRCQVYIFRPLVCRIFGFSARRDKMGQYQLITCDVIRKAFPKQYELAQQVIKQGFTPAIAQSYRSCIQNISTADTNKFYSFNEALYLAFMKIGLVQSFRRV